MKVVILAGGFGTRLSEETAVIPKPMIEIGGYPLIWHIMKLFSQQGFNEFIVALGYKGEVIKRYFLEYTQIMSNLSIDLHSGHTQSSASNTEPWKIELIDTGLETMTGGRLRRLRDHLHEPFFLTYGDGLSNVNLKQLLAHHQSHGKLATVTAVKPPARFGILDLEGDQVKEFSEKDPSADPYINGGFFVLQPEVIDYIQDDITPWEKEPCQNLARDGQLNAFKHDAFWQCVDTLHELRLLRALWNEGKAPWKTWK